MVFLRVGVPVVNTTAKRVYGHASQEVCPWNVKVARERPEGSPFSARELFQNAGSREDARAGARDPHGGADGLRRGVQRLTD